MAITFARLATSESGFISTQATRFRGVFDDIDASTLEAQLRDARATFDWPIPQPAVADRLQTISTRHTPAVAEALADVSLNDPGLARKQPTGEQLEAAVDTFDPIARFERAANALQTINNPPSALRDGILREALHDHLDDPTSQSTLPDLPLLDLPLTWRDDQRTSDPAVGTSPRGTAINQTLAAGPVGTAVYSEPSNGWNWLVNPHIASTTTDDGTPYSKLWHGAYLFDGLLEQLFDRARTPGSPSPLTCPFCTLCHGQCADDNCRARQYINRINEILPELVDAL